MVGEVLGGFRLVRELGRGGMGAVWLAEHTLIGKRAAVKLLLPAKAADPELVRRFFNEARAAARLNHPGMVDVFDYGVDPKGRAYLVMEHLEGESLGSRLRRGRLDPALALDIARQVAGALAAAHAEGIVHRDLKPDNLFLTPDPAAAGGIRVKVLDFGIAKLTRAEGADTTAEGALLGTPLYMSPEQCRGASDVDARADVYSLGVIFYHMVCGRPPFVRPGVGEVLAAHMHEAPQLPRALAPDLSPAIEGLILQLLVKDPAARLPSMRAFLDELDGLARGTPAPAPGEPVSVLADTAASDECLPPPRRRPRRWGRVAVVAASLLIGAGALGLVLLPPRDLRERCARGDGEACVKAAVPIMARVDPRGTGDELVPLYQKGCDAGSLLACARLGDLYDRGFGVPLAFDRAAALFLRACDGGLADGCAQLGTLYESGNGVRADRARAETLYRKSCEAKSGLGCGGLAMERGRHLDFAGAIAAGRKGCDLGVAFACFMAGDQMLIGDTVGDEAAAKHRFARAWRLADAGCQAGDPLACHTVGDMAFSGRGVERD